MARALVYVSCFCRLLVYSLNLDFKLPLGSLGVNYITVIALSSIPLVESIDVGTQHLVQTTITVQNKGIWIV